MKKLSLKKLASTALLLILALDVTHPVLASDNTPIDVSKLSAEDASLARALKAEGKTPLEIRASLEKRKQEMQESTTSGQNQKHLEEIKSLREEKAEAQQKLELQEKELERLKAIEEARLREDERLKTLTGQDGGKSIPKADILSIAEIARLQDENKKLAKALEGFEEGSPTYKTLKDALNRVQSDLEKVRRDVDSRKNDNLKNTQTTNNTNTPTISTTTPTSTTSTTTSSSTTSRSPTTQPPEIKLKSSELNSTGNEPIQQTVGQTKPQRGGPGGGTPTKQGLVNSINKAIDDETYTSGSSHLTLTNDPTLYNTWHYYGLTLEELKEHMDCVKIMNPKASIALWNQAIQALKTVVTSVVTALPSNPSDALANKKTLAEKVNAIYMEVSTALKSCTKDSYSLEQFNTAIGSNRTASISTVKSSSTASSENDKKVSLTIGVTGEEGKKIRDELFTIAETLVLNDPSMIDIDKVMKSINKNKEEAEKYISIALALIKDYLEDQKKTKRTQYLLPPAITKFFDGELKKDPNTGKDKFIEWATVYIKWEILTEIKKSLMTETTTQINKQKTSMITASKNMESANKRGDARDEKKWKETGEKINESTAPYEWLINTLEKPELQLNKEITIQQEKFKEAYGFDPEKVRK
jgi:exonuclease VII small subunit